MSTIAVTGAAGYIGQRLLDRLAADPEVEKVLALDVRRFEHPSEKIVSVPHDVRHAMDAFFTEHDVRRAIHLAYILNPIHDRGLMRAVNVDGTDNFLRACAAAEVDALIVVSSGTAYGAWPDNPPRLTESDPLRGKPGFPYVEDKLEQERLARGYQLAHPKTRVMVVRPSVVIGGNINNFISRFYSKRVAVTVQGYNPPVPLVHEEDVARALWYLLRQGSTGAYNLDAPDPPLLTEAAQMLGSRAVGVPAGLLYPIADLGWHLRIKAITEAPAAMLDYIRYSWLMDGTKVARDTDFDYAKTAREALLGFVAAVNGGERFTS